HDHILAPIDAAVGADRALIAGDGIVAVAAHNGIGAAEDHDARSRWEQTPLIRDNQVIAAAAVDTVVEPGYDRRPVAIQESLIGGDPIIAVAGNDSIVSLLVIDEIDSAAGVDRVIAGAGLNQV